MLVKTQKTLNVLRILVTHSPNGSQPNSQALSPPPHVGKERKPGNEVERFVATFILILTTF